MTNLVVSDREPDADQFRVGDIWLNSRGARHRVLRVEGRIAHLVNEATGRTVAKPWDGIGAHTGRPWVRESCGQSAQNPRCSARERHTP